MGNIKYVRMMEVCALLSAHVTEEMVLLLENVTLETETTTVLPSVVIPDDASLEITGKFFSCIFFWWIGKRKNDYCC